MTIDEVLNLPDFEFNHASIDITVPAGEDMVEYRCYFIDDSSKRRKTIDDLLESVDYVIVGIFGKINGQMKTYISEEHKRNWRT